MTKKTGIRRLLAWMLCLVLMTNSVTVYGAELFIESEDTVVEQNVQTDEAGTDEWPDAESDMEEDDVESTGDSYFSDGTDSTQLDTELNVTEESEDPEETEFTSEETSCSEDAGEELFQSSDEPAVYADGGVSSYGQEIAQDIYWQDNNVTTDRYTTDQYRDWFYENGKIAISYKDNNGADIVEYVKVRNLITDQSKMTVTDQGGTGHYVMKFESGAFSGIYTPKDSEGNPIVDSEGNPVNYTIEQIDLVPPNSIADHEIPANNKYYFQEITDDNKTQYTNQEVGNGWYYLKQYDFTVNLEFRYGSIDITGLPDEKKEALKKALKTALEKEFVFSYKKSINATETEVSLEAIRSQYGNDIVDITVDSSGNLVATLTVPKIPQYRVDGTERTYHIEEIHASDDYKLNADTSFILKDLLGDAYDGDYLAISYDNSNVANFGTITDSVYRDGTLILTLKGDTTYTGTKIWQDEENPKHRPTTSFTLWRYSKKPGTDYTTASQVSNQNGETLKFVLPDEPDTSNFTIDFDYNTNALHAAGSVLLTDGEKLPKYDPEGYEYVYFTKEIMNSVAEDADYTQFFGELVPASAENEQITVKGDVLPSDYDGTTRKNTDKSIYNTGTISNSLTGTVDTKIQKQWKAQAFQGQLSDVRVTFELQARHKTQHGTEENPSLADEWYTVKNGEDSITMEMSGFSEESLVQTDTRNMPKYDDMGHELEYQWVETGVYQGGNSTTNLLQTSTDADGNISREFTLNQNGEAIHYTSKVETTTDQNGNSSSVITNRIAKDVNYEVTKKWIGEDGKEYTPSDGREIKLSLVRQSSDGTTKELGRFVLNGTAGHTDEIIDTENNDQKILCSEPSAWKARFENLPQYDADGRWYDYTVLEVQDNKYLVRYGEVEYDKEHNTYQNIISNYPPGTSHAIYVRKKWVDDSDSEHRGAVTFTIYQRTAENTFKEIDKVNLTSLDFWQKEVAIDTEIDLKDILVLETAVKNTGNTDSATVPNTDKDGLTEQARVYTSEEMEAIWKLYHSQQMSENEGNTANDIYYFSDEHWYHTTYAMEQLTAGEEGMQGVPYYTVTNQRLGRINLTVTKTWVDGDHTAQKDLLNQLQKIDPNAGLYVKLSCDYEDAITDAQTGKINIGNGEQQITLNDKTTPTGIYQKIALNGSGTGQSMYFFNLPKYDSHGKVVHYSVSEVYAKKTTAGTIEELTDEEKAKISTDYIQMLSSTYTVNAHHTDDEQYFTLTNKLSGVKNVQFHKKWLDRYQFLKGNRPDIYLSLYRQIHTRTESEDGQAIISTSLESIFIDHEWTNTSDESNTNYHWTVTLKNQPKYDEYGYEITYYAEEKMHVDASKFDYIPVYYEYRINGTDTKVGNASGPDDLVTDESGNIQSKYVDAGYIVPKDSSGSTYLLREDGTFVNKLQKDIRIEGKKIWGNIPSGFPDEELPTATFTLRRYKARKADQTPDYDESFTSSITINSGNWGAQKVNSEYRFVLGYTGVNINSTENNILTAVPATGNENAEPIQLYDDFGNRYDYQVTEELTMPSDANGNVTDKTLVYIDPQVNEFVVQNYYRSAKGQLTVKKILDVQKEDAETYPSVTFELIRRYKNNKGELIEDTSFGTKTLTLKHDQFTDNNGVVSQTGTFENLEIYAPNGREYQYCIKEKREGLGSYTLTYVGVGDCAKGVGNTKLPDGQTEPANQLNAAASEDTNAESSYTAQVSGLYASDDKDDPKVDATFQNKASDDTVILTGTKKWDDNNNALNLRPSVEQLNGQDSNYQVPAISVKVYRYANAQSGESNAIGSVDSPLEVEPSKYFVSWSTDTNGNTYKYTVTGNSGELEKYAPNGMAWIYGVKETYGNEKDLPGYKTNTGYYWCGEAAKDANDSWIVTVPTDKSITNSLTKTNVRVMKRWIAKENVSKEQNRVTDSNIGDNKTYKDYLGYYMKVQFKLQARINGKYKIDNSIENTATKSKWMNVKDLFTDTNDGLGMGTDAAGINKYKSAFQTAVTNSSYGSFDNNSDIVFDLKGYMTQDGSWVASFNGSSMLPEKVNASSGSYVTTDGSYYRLEYRLIEQQIAVYANSSASSPLATIQFSGIQDGYTSASMDYNNSKMQYGDTQISAKNLFTLIGQNYNNLQGGVPGSLWNNLLPVTQLTVKKEWNDTSNTYGTRYLKDGKWSVDFVIQRKIKSVATASWENVYSYNNGKRSDKFTTVTITGKDDCSESGSATINGLPVYGINTDGTVVEYEYRARELNPGWESAKTETELAGYIIGGDSGTKQEHAYKGNMTGTTDGIYDVTATDSVPNETSANGKTEQKHYQTIVANVYNGILTRYAQKQWNLPAEFSVTGKTGKTVWNYPVTLELKYKKTDGTLQSFTKPAKVTLDGTTDEGVNSNVSDLTEPYGEYEAWKAIWKGIPDYIPGSETETTSDGKTITKYYIVETQTGFYQTSNPADGQAGRDDGTNNLTFINTPTELLVSKTVDLGDAYEFNLDDQEFTFKLTNDSDVSGEYWMVKKKKDSNGNLVSADTTAYPKQYNIDGTKTTDTFTLKNGETMVFYGLPIYKTGSTTEKVTYTVTETNSHPSGTGFETKFDTTVTASNSDTVGTAGTTSASKDGLDGASGSVKFPSSAPAGDAEKTATAFTNTLEGAIHLIKTDGAGNKLAGAEFTIKYRKKGSTDEFKDLSDTVCSNLTDNTTGNRAGVKVSDSEGKVDFTDLKLGYEYQITETKAPDGALGLQGPIIVELPMLLAENTTANGSIKPVTATTDGKKVFVELQYTISNSKFSMPVTSGSGFFWPGMLGLALAGAGCIVWTCTGTKKKKREEITK